MLFEGAGALDIVGLLASGSQVLTESIKSSCLTVAVRNPSSTLAVAAPLTVNRDSAPLSIGTNGPSVAMLYRPQARTTTPIRSVDSY